MSSVDLHPEELLDKLERGALTAPERERLAVHLECCEVCRFELSVRHDFEQEARASGASVRQSTAPLPKIAASDASTSRISRSKAGRRLVRRWTTAWGVAAAFLVLAAVSLASYATRGAWPWVRPPESNDAGQSPASGRRVAMGNTERAPGADGRALEPEAAATAAAAAPHDGLSPNPAASAHNANSLPSSAPKPPGAPELFSAANQARREGDTVGALELYRKLERRFPVSEEAVLSHVIVGRMLLNADPASALSGFDAYLATGAPALAAEARVGRARALALLGRSAEARAAWHEVLARYPQSVYAEEARATLGIVNSP